MKVLLTAILISICSAGMATEITVSAAETTQVEASIGADRGKRKARRNKRINKKRKRKCNNFGRRSFAG
jgi:hypothetical protein